MSNEFFEKLGQAQPTIPRVGTRYDTAPTPNSTGKPADAAVIAASRWAAAGDSFWGAEETYDSLPSGLYRCDLHPQLGAVLRKQKHDTDGLLELPDDASLSILSEFDDFWKREDKFRERGFLHKRGFLLWGPPGSGKTSCLNMLMKRLIRDRDGVILFLDTPGVAAQALRLIRMIEPTRPVVAVMEDIDALVQNYGEHEYLALLDGEAQVDRIAFLATTNYPERLDRRFCDRPSRFDTIRYIGMPEPAARDAYLSAKEPSLTTEEREQWVAHTDGFSLAHLKELIVAVKCLGQPFASAVQRLEDMRVQRPSSEDVRERTAGFLGPARRIASAKIGSAR